MLTYQTTNNYAWGTFVLTPNSGVANGVGFIAQDFTITETTWTAERNDNIGQPNGWLGGVERITGRGTLQLANANVVAPQRFDTFTRALRYGANANTFVFTEISLPKKQRDFDVVEVTFKESI